MKSHSAEGIAWHVGPAGVTNVNELSSKHAKARAPSTQHDSAAEWQQQTAQEGAKGKEEEWEGDLLILGVGNAQQAGMQLCGSCQPMIAT